MLDKAKVRNELYSKFNVHDILDLASDLVNRFELDYEPGDDIDETLMHALDDGLIYSADQWEMIMYYCTPQYANYDDAFESFYSDLLEIISKSLISD